MPGRQRNVDQGRRRSDCTVVICFHCTQEVSPATSFASRQRQLLGRTSFHGADQEQSNVTDGIQAASWFKSGKAYCIEDDLRRSVLAETGISTNGQRYSIGNVLFPALLRAHAPGQRRYLAWMMTMSGECRVSHWS